jgi:hypothetical protein
MIGAYIGMRSRSVRDLGRSHKDHASSRGVLEISIYKSWATSLTAFGLMNTVALVHHCLLPPPKTYGDSNIHRKIFDNFLATVPGNRFHVFAEAFGGPDANEYRF